MGIPTEMKKIQTPVSRKAGCEDLDLPKYMSEHASGMDIPAAVNEPVELRPGDIKLIPTGIYLAVPPGYEAQVRPRSGLALKHGVTVANAPGTIDADYRGEVGVILTNIGREPFKIERGERIAQLVFQPVVRAEWIEQDRLESTDRADGGFGHTGR